MSFSAFENEYHRLAILQFLNEQPGYTGNADIVATSLQSKGRMLTVDQVKTELYWLSEQSLVDISITGDLVRVTLTGRGGECAAGIARVPGVARPRPGAGSA